MMKKILIILFLLSSSFNAFTQNDCSTAYQYCGNNVALPLVTNIPDLGSADCLASTPNAAWFYFEIAQNGDVATQITGVDAVGSSGLDIDVVVFGPFASLDCDTITADLNANPVVDCDYSTSGVIPYVITGAQIGEIYVVLVTNYSNNNGLAEFVDQGSTAGFVQTNCITEVNEISDDLNSVLIINPFQENLQVKNLPNENYSISIFDITGRIIYTEANSSRELNINLSNIVTGNYLFQLVNEKGDIITKKIIKN